MKKYIRSFVSFSLGTWLRAIISIFTTPIVTYLIIPEEFGKSAMYATAFGVVNLLVLLGMDQTFVRFFNEYGKDSRNKLLWSCLFPSLITTGLLSLVMLILSNTISILLYGKVYPYINLIFVLNIYLSLFQRYNHLIIRMQQKGLMYSTIEVVSAVSSVVFTIVFALFSRTFYAVVLGGLVGMAVALMVGITQGREYWRPARLAREEVRKALAFGLPFIPTSLLFWLFASIDRISLRQYSTFVQIGLYSAAFKIVSIMNLVQNGFTTFWAPTAYERYSKSGDDPRFFERANEVVSFAMFSAGFLILASKDLIFLLLAKSYRESSMIFPFLLFSPIMYSISETTVVWINFKKKTYWHIVIVSVAALVNYVGNTVLVPIYAAKGAAVSTGISYIVFFAMRTLVAKKVYPAVRYKLGKIALVTAAMCAVAFVQTLQNNVLANILSGLLGAVVTIIVYKEVFNSLKRELKDILITRFAK